MISERAQYLHQFREDLVSQRFAHPSAAIKEKTVILCAHGFGASPYSFQEFKDYAESSANCLVSAILLGKHETLETFADSSWQDWAEPILDEYRALLQLGFTRFILCGASTGAALLLQLLQDEAFENSHYIHHCVFIDPLLVFRDKKIHFLPIAKHFISDPKVELTDEEKPFWLPIRPKTTLLQLLKLANRSKKALEKGLTLRKHLAFHIFQSKNDPIINPISSEIIHRSLVEKSKVNSNKHLIDTTLHVPLRLAGRDNVSSADIQNQRFMFESILTLIPD